MITTNSITDNLYVRVQQTLHKKREYFLRCDADGSPLGCGSAGTDTFEFLIFLEIRDDADRILMQYPVAIGHEPLLEEVMRGQLAVYSCLITDYSLAVVAIENTLATFDEWDQFGRYATAEELIKAKFGKTDADKLNSENYQPISFEQIEEQTIEAVRFTADDSEPLPIVISARRANSGNITVS